MKLIQLDVEALVNVKSTLTPNCFLFLNIIHLGYDEVALPYYENFISKADKESLFFYFKDTPLGFILRPPSLILFKEEIESVESWVESYRTLFPVHKKGDRLSCIKKLKKFVKERPYGKDIIIQATKAYLESLNHTPIFIKRADYFIEKEGTSFLAGFCETAESGIVDNDDYLFSKTI